MKTLTKIGAITVIGMMSLGLVGCTAKIPLADHDAMVKDLTDQLSEKSLSVETLQKQYDELKAQADVSATDLAKTQEDLLAAKEQAARDALIMEDLKKVVDEIKAKDEAAAQTVRGSLQGKEVIDDLDLGASLSDTTLDHNDLEFLEEGEFKFDGDTYEFEERLELTSDLGVETSLSGDEDFADKAALVFDSEESIVYKFVVEESFDYTEISEDEPLRIKLLGKPYTIIDMDASSMTVVEGTEYGLKEGASVEHDGKTIKLELVAVNDKVYVTVDGVAVVVDEGDSEEVAGLSIRADDVLYSEKGGWATLTVSKTDAEREIDNGDEYVDGDDKFEWVIETSGTDLESIGIVYTEQANDADETVLMPGGKFSFAGLFDIGFDYESDYDYRDFELDFDEATTSDIPSVRFVAHDGKDLVLGDEELEEVWFDGTSYYYKDENNDWVTDSLNDLELENDDMSYVVSYVGTDLFVGPIKLDLSGGFTYFGAFDEEAEATDLMVGASSLGKRDQDVLLTDGTIIDAPENGLDNDKVSFMMPSDTVKALISVGR